MRFGPAPAFGARIGGAGDCGVPMVFSVHSRTAKNLRELESD